MSVESDLNFIKRLCIINFFELLEIKRKLNISTFTGDSTHDSNAWLAYANAMENYMKEMDDKMRELIRDYPHLQNDISS